MWKLIVLAGIAALFLTQDVQNDRNLQYMLGFAAFTILVIIFVLGGRNNRA